MPRIAGEREIDGEDLFPEIQSSGGGGSGELLSLIIQNDCRRRVVRDADRLKSDSIRSQTIGHGEQAPFRLHA